LGWGAKYGKKTARMPSDRIIGRMMQIAHQRSMRPMYKPLHTQETYSHIHRLRGKEAVPHHILIGREAVLAALSSFSIVQEVADSNAYLQIYGR
jgi:hypothetical protein